MDPRRLEMTVLMTPTWRTSRQGAWRRAPEPPRPCRLLLRLALLGRYAVTLSVDQVTFKEPINVGELVTFRASVNHTGRTSMEVGIRVEAENIRSGTLRHTNSCYFTMVAVDDAGRPARSRSSRSRTRRRPPPRAAGLRRGLRREIADQLEERRGGRGMSVWSWDGIVPVIDPTAFVHPDATVIGDVIVGPGVYVGPQCVLRGDFGRIEIGAGANVQETCVVHTFPNLGGRGRPSGHIGHGAVLHGCRIGRNAMVGMNAVVMDEAEVGENSIVAAMAFVKAGARSRPGASP